MPIYDFECKECGAIWEELVFDGDIVTCRCGGRVKQLPALPGGVKIKGLRASNRYGLESIDTYGKCKISGLESGYSFTDKRGTANYNARNGGGDINDR